VLSTPLVFPAKQTWDKAVVASSNTTAHVVAGLAEARRPDQRQSMSAQQASCTVLSLLLAHIGAAHGCSL
jgi:hypothetical protein